MKFGGHIPLSQLQNSKQFPVFTSLPSGPPIKKKFAQVSAFNILQPGQVSRPATFVSPSDPFFLQLWFKKQGTFVRGPCHSPPRNNTHASITHPPLGRIFLHTPLFNPLLGDCWLKCSMWKFVVFLVFFENLWLYLVVRLVHPLPMTSMASHSSTVFKLRVGISQGSFSGCHLLQESLSD